jgi:hypothetical protein
VCKIEELELTIEKGRNWPMCGKLWKNDWIHGNGDEKGWMNKKDEEEEGGMLTFNKFRVFPS